MIRNPSCLISYIQCSPEGTFIDLVGRHGRYSRKHAGVITAHYGVRETCGAKECQRTCAVALRSAKRALRNLMTDRLHGSMPLPGTRAVVAGWPSMPGQGSTTP